jgi:site-specific recombinase XerD
LFDVETKIAHRFKDVKYFFLDFTKTMLYIVYKNKHAKENIMTKQALNDRVTEFIKYSIRRNLSKATVRLYQTVLDEMVEFWPGETPRKAMTAYVNSLNNKPGTIKVKSVICRRFWNWMVKNDYCKSNPTNHIEGVKVNDSRTRFLSTDEIGAIIEHSSPTMRVIIEVAIFTGLRRSTVLGLKWDDVDLDQMLITTKTKGNVIARIPITEKLAIVLLAYRSLSSSAYLFPNKKGTGPLDSNALIEFRATCNKLGMKDVCFHTLRHSFASHFLKATGNIYLLKEMLGHASISTTQRYAHIMNEDRVKGMSAFNATMSLGT